jgi:antitoxin component YwqK of YwqJK toxin-antitoxin module
MKFNLNSFLFGLIGLLSISLFSQEIKQYDGYYYINNKLYSGVYDEKSADGYVVTKFSIKNGLLDGITEIYEKDILVEKRSFKSGKKHGLWERFENEKMISKAMYIRDNKHGKWLIWDSEGVLRYEMYYKRGKKVGVWKMWDEKGKLISEKKY